MANVTNSRLCKVAAALAARQLQALLGEVGDRLARQILGAANHPSRPDLWRKLEADPCAVSDAELEQMTEHEPQAVKDFWANLSDARLRGIVRGETC